MSSARWAALAVLAGTLACGEQPVVPQPEPVVVEAAVSVSPSTVTPGQSTRVTASATLPDTALLRQAWLLIHAFDAETTLALPRYGRGSHEWWFDFTIRNGPFEGEVLFRLMVQIAEDADTAEAALRIQDDGPPQLSLRMPTVLEPPDTLSIVADASDAAGITSIILHVRGAAYRDIAMHYDYAPSATLTQALWFPGATALGDSIVVTAETLDGFGKAAGRAERAVTADTTYPSVTVYVDTVWHNTPIDVSGFPLLFFPGDSVHVHTTASDNYSLDWIGFEYLGVRDSIASDSLAASASFHLLVPPGANTDAPIQAFARDRAGHRARDLVSAWALDGQFRPILDQLKSYPTPNVWVIDARQDILYSSDFSTSLHRLGLTPLTAMTSIDFGQRLMSVGLSPAGDSLWVLLTDGTPQAQHPHMLLGWDVARGLPATDTIRLPELANCYARSMQITSTYHALVKGWMPGGCPTLDVDLRTRTRRLLSLPPQLFELTASPDLSTVVAWDDSSAVVYLPETDGVGPVRTTCCSVPGETPNRRPSFDRSGTSILLHNRLYDRFLSSYRWLGPEQRDLPGIQALSLDGSTAFVGGLPGYWRFDTVSGALRERVILPGYADRLLLHPDGQRMLVFTAGWVGVVDLR